MAAASPLFSATSSTTIENRKFSYNILGSVLLQNPKTLFAAKPRKNPFRGCASKSGDFLDHIPKQFRGENLEDGLMDNYKNFPRSLYGLPPSVMEMFMTDGKAEKITGESISSASSYLRRHGGMGTWSDMNGQLPGGKYSMGRSTSSEGGGRSTSRKDLAKELLSRRIIYLGSPIVPKISMYIIAQLMYLEWESRTKPIRLCINSSGTLAANGEIAGRADAYGIVDMMSYCQSDIYTLNIGTADGQAAMLLCNGAKGNRVMMPHSSVNLYLPQFRRSIGPSTDMWMEQKEVDMVTDTYLEFLAKGIGKPQEEIMKDIQHGKFFDAKDAVEYGIADKIEYGIADKIGIADAKE